MDSLRLRRTLLIASAAVFAGTALHCARLLFLFQGAIVIGTTLAFRSLSHQR